LSKRELIPLENQEKLRKSITEDIEANKDELVGIISEEVLAAVLAQDFEDSTLKCLMGLKSKKMTNKDKLNPHGK
jgi:hypothetical protein